MKRVFFKEVIQMTYWYMKKCLSSLTFRVIKIRMMRKLSSLTSEMDLYERAKTACLCRNMKEKKSIHFIGGEINWFRLYGK